MSYTKAERAKFQRIAKRDRKAAWAYLAELDGGDDDDEDEDEDEDEDTPPPKGKGKGKGKGKADDDDDDEDEQPAPEDTWWYTRPRRSRR